jgi:hypothetical protein
MLKTLDALADKEFRAGIEKFALKAVLFARSAIPAAATLRWSFWQAQI